MKMRNAEPRNNASVRVIVQRHSLACFWNAVILLQNYRSLEVQLNLFFVMFIVVCGAASYAR